MLAITLIYIAVTLGSFVIVGDLVEDIEKKIPSLTNKRLKRSLWLISCFLSVPLIIEAIKVPILLWEDIKDFVDDLPS